MCQCGDTVFDLYFFDLKIQVSCITADLICGERLMQVRKALVMLVKTALFMFT
jgi:hypothetical protein